MGKPEPIRIAPAGIAAGPVNLGATERDWGKIFALPPFAVFLDENKISDIAAYAPEELWEMYAAWHGQKGCWKNENPDGSLKQ